MPMGLQKQSKKSYNKQLINLEKNRKTREFLVSALL